MKSEEFRKLTEDMELGEQAALIRAYIIENMELKQQLAASEQRFDALIAEIESLQEYEETRAGVMDCEKGIGFYYSIMDVEDVIRKYKHSPNSEQK